MTLESRTVEYLQRLPVMDSPSDRRAFLYVAFGGERVQLDYAGDPRTFCNRLVARLARYGTLEDGRSATEVLLVATKTADLGPDDQALCEELVAEWRDRSSALQASKQGAARQPGPVSPEGQSDGVLKRSRNVFVGLGIVVVLMVSYLVFYAPNPAPEPVPADTPSHAVAPTQIHGPEPTATGQPKIELDQAEAIEVPTSTSTPRPTATVAWTPTPLPMATSTLFPVPETVIAGIDPPAGAVDGDVWINPVDGAEYAYVSGGEFLMGEDLDPIRVDGFWIMRTEVTNAQYRRFIDAGGYHEPAYWTEAGWRWRQDNDVNGPSCGGNGDYSQADHPVVCVSWYESVAYTRWLTSESGREFRLPSEAQWEKAARGTDGRAFPWGDEWNGSWLNYCDLNCIGWKDETASDGYRETGPVGSYPKGASPYGVMDMAGNVWEWTSSKYAPLPYKEDGREDLEGSATRTLRGGSWGSIKDWVHCAYRFFTSPSSRVFDRGFRVVFPHSA